MLWVEVTRQGFRILHKLAAADPTLTAGTVVNTSKLGGSRLRFGILTCISCGTWASAAPLVFRNKRRVWVFVG